MGKSLPSIARSSRFLAAAIVLTIACKETTAPPVPAKLVFLTMQPGATIANTAIAPALKVAVQDADGNILTSATNIITLSIGTNPTQARLLGNATVAAIDGVATFSDLSIDKVGLSFTLTASSPNLTSATTNPFSVVFGALAKLVFTVQPVTTLARTPIPPFTVGVQDAAGNLVPSFGINIAVRIGFNAGGGVLSGIANRTIGAVGTVTFTDLTINNPGTGYTLTAFTATTNPAIAAVNSNPFDQTVGAAAKVAFTTQPLLTGPGEVIPAVLAAVQDSVGNIVRTAAPTMTIAIGANSGNATLTGTTTISAVNGVATFSDLRINNAGTGYTLVVSSPGLASGTTIPFSVRNALVFASVAAGYFHSCGLTTTGDAYCWGANGVGQTGDVTTPTPAPEPVPGGLKFVSLTAGRDHNCGVTASGDAYCWGSNEEGQLGSVGSLSRVPVAVAGGRTFTAVMAGYAHTCGLAVAGAVYCWGDNSAGAL